jgi:hypothetical protein
MTSESELSNNEKNPKPILGKSDCVEFIKISTCALSNMANALQNIRHERGLERYIHDVDGDILVLNKELKRLITTIEDKFQVRLFT